MRAFFQYCRVCTINYTKAAATSIIVKAIWLEFFDDDVLIFIRFLTKQDLIFVSLTLSMKIVVYVTQQHGTIVEMTENECLHKFNSYLNWLRALYTIDCLVSQIVSGNTFFVSCWWFDYFQEKLRYLTVLFSVIFCQ